MFSGDKVNKLSWTRLKFRFQRTPRTRGILKRPLIPRLMTALTTLHYRRQQNPQSPPLLPVQAISTYLVRFFCAIFLHVPRSFKRCLVFRVPHQTHVPRGSRVCLFPLTISGEMNTKNSLLEVYSWGIVRVTVNVLFTELILWGCVASHLEPAPLPRSVRSLVCGHDNRGIVVWFSAGARDCYCLQIVVTGIGAHPAS